MRLTGDILSSFILEIFVYLSVEEFSYVILKNEKCEIFLKTESLTCPGSKAIPCVAILGAKASLRDNRLPYSFCVAAVILTNPYFGLIFVF